MKRLEVGQVYKLGRRLWLAMGEGLLVCVQHGKIIERKPSGAIQVQRTASVELLCISWSTTLGMIDTITTDYLQPQAHRNKDVRQRMRRNDGPGLDERSEAILLRLYRINF